MPRFQAVWPVLDPTMDTADLIAEAIEDLPRVARRHGAITIGEPTVRVLPGAQVPGAGTTGLVVVAESDTAATDRVAVFHNPCEISQCERCGIERTINSKNNRRRYCTDCRPWAKADGWIEAAA